MLLLSLLIAASLNYVWESHNPVHRDHWLYPLRQALKPWLVRLKLTGSSSEFAAILGLCGGIILLISLLLERHASGLFLVFATIVLLYSLGRGEPSRATSEFIVAEAKGNWDEAIAAAATLHTPCDDLQTNDWQELNRRFFNQCTYQGFERHFAVIFWFVLLGPAGAFAYRFTKLWLIQNEPSEIPEDTPKIALEKNKSISHFLWLMEWPAIRVLGLSYAITGNFAGCMHAWKPTSICRQRSSQAILELCVRGALAINDKLQPNCDMIRRELDALEQLNARTLWCWLVVIAIGLML